MKVILNCQKVCDEIAKVFTKKYYPDADYCDGDDSWWVSDRPGSVFYICDRFYSVDRMIEALELKADRKSVV